MDKATIVSAYGRGTTTSKLNNFLWHPHCQISNLFIVLTIISLIGVLTLPSTYYVFKNHKEGSVVKIEITCALRWLVFLGVLLGSALVNHCIIVSCDSGKEGWAITSFILAPVLIWLSILVVLLITGQKVNIDDENC